MNVFRIGDIFLFRLRVRSTHNKHTKLLSTSRYFVARASLDNKRKQILNRKYSSAYLCIVIFSSFSTCKKKQLFRQNEMENDFH